LLSVEWTLRHEVLFYSIVGLVIWKPRIGAVFAFIWVMSSAIGSAFTLAYPWSFFFSSYHLLFAFGAAAATAFSRGFNKLPITMFVSGVALFAATWTVLCLRIPLQSSVVTHWIYGLGATLVILGAANLERSRTLHVPRAVVFLGEASYSIYLVHLPVISAASKLVKKLDGKAPDALLFVATAVIALDAGIIFHIAIEKPLVGLMQGLPAPQVSSG